MFLRTIVEINSKVESYESVYRREEQIKQCYAGMFLRSGSFGIGARMRVMSHVVQTAVGKLWYIIATVHVGVVCLQQH